MTRQTVVTWRHPYDEQGLVAAVVFLAAYAIPIIYPELPAWLAAACRMTNLLVWGVFAVDLIIRVILAPRRRHYVLTD